VNSALEIEKTEIDAEIRIKTPDGIKAFLDQESVMLKKMVEEEARYGSEQRGYFKPNSWRHIRPSRVRRWPVPGARRRFGNVLRLRFLDYGPL
jgi:hypothetical protein